MTELFLNLLAFTGIILLAGIIIAIVFLSAAMVYGLNNYRKDLLKKKPTAEEKAENREVKKKRKIGWKDFKVEISKPSSVLKAEASDCYGDIYWEKNRIRINSEYDTEQQQATLLHEILHGVSELTCLDLSEDVVRRLANGLYMVIKDNPELFQTKEAAEND